MLLGVEPPDPALVSADDATRLACWMLRASRPWPDMARGVMEALYRAHRDEEGDAAVWRALRRDAAELSEHPGDEVRMLGAVAEAAAWPLTGSRSGLTELLTAISRLRARQATKATGWSDEDEAEARRKLEDIARGDGDARPSRDQIPGLFREAHPVTEARFVRSLDAGNSAHIAFRAEVAAWIAGASRR